MPISFALYAMTEALFSASPGPAVALVISSYLSGGKLAANAAIWGILFGNIIYFMVAGFLIVTSSGFNESILFYLKIGGVIYLLYVLFSEYILSRGRAADAEDVRISIKKSRPWKKFFSVALVMQLANPKTILFFSAFLPQFISNKFDIVPQIAILMMISMVVEYSILLIYVYVTHQITNKITGQLKAQKILRHTGNVAMALAVVWGTFFM